MKFFRSAQLFRKISIFLFTVTVASLSWGQDGQYPMRPIRLVLPYSTGGSADVLARLISPKLGEALGQPIVVENRPGAGGILGVNYVAKMPADGYTLLMSSSAEAMLPSLYKKPPYDYIREFSPISMLVDFPFLILVNASFPANSLKELIALAKSKPGEVTYSSAGNGASSHIVPEQFATAFGVRLMHVPYKGTGPAVLALVSGEANMGVYSVASTIQQVKSGRLRALAITSLKRSPSFPDIPTVAESLSGYEASIWIGLLAPAGTPQPIVARINRELSKVMRFPEIRDRLVGLDLDLVASTPEDFGATIRKDVTKWSKVVKDSGATAD